MFNSFYIHDEYAARAYEANLAAQAGYSTGAQLTRRQGINHPSLFSLLAKAIASLFAFIIC